MANFALPGLILAALLLAIPHNVEADTPADSTACSQNWVMKSQKCEYDDAIASDWYGDGNWKVYIEPFYDGIRPEYTYEKAKEKCESLGATLVREQDVLDAVRL